MNEFEQSVAEAAQAFGVEPGYWDISGHRHETSHELRIAILSALGVPCGSAEAVRDFLEAHKQRAQARRLRPTYVVHSPGAVVEAEPEGEADPRVEWEAVVRLEDGSSRQWAIPFEDIQSGKIQVPGSLPPGYHRIAISSPGVEHSARLIVAPERGWLPEVLEKGGRRAGLAISLFGVHSANTWGCGDFTALERVIDWVVQQTGGSYIALNPLHAIHNRSPFNTSPYLPNSIFYRNPIYIDVDRVADLERSEEALEARRDPATLAEIERLNAAELVDYEAVHALKLRFLRMLFARFLRDEHAQGTARDLAFRRYREAEGALLDRFAIYCALDEHLHAANPGLWVWPDWPAEYRDPESPAVAEFARSQSERVLFHKYLQWLIDEQAARAQRHAIDAGMEIGLFHDMPLATDRCGFELWANRPYYVAGCRVGSPPDDFAPNGQDWSFPPPNREALREDGYRLFIESIRKSARHGGALRIDHVMRLFRLFWIPDGLDATKGTYVRDYADDLLGILALESVRNQVLIVGEDLGTVEDGMREALARYGILSYRLFYFEREGDGSFRDAAEYPRQALVSSTTHDLPTLAGYWSARDIETRHSLGLLDDAGFERQMQERARDKHLMFRRLQSLGFMPQGFPEAAADGPELSGELHNAITGFLASTPSMLMTLNQEDLTKELDQQNVPATTWQYPNWRRKMKFSVEDLYTQKMALNFAAMLRHRLSESGRMAGVREAAESNPESPLPPPNLP
ncbi:MAG: 4-alpha-glucanotransferase [Bryobacteraceae bacterium]